MTPDVIARIQDRDDLLHLANDVADVVTVIREEDTNQLGRNAIGQPLLIRALRRHLENAQKTDKPSMRSDSYAHAAVIVEFRMLLGEKLPPPGIDPDMYDIDWLYGKALVTAYTGSGSVDLWRRVALVHRYTRALRLAGRYDDALELADQPEDFFVGSGLEPIRSYYEFEWCATLLAKHRTARQAPDLVRLQAWIMSRRNLYQQILDRWRDEQAAEGILTVDIDGHWSRKQRRNRFEFACGLAELAALDVSDPQPADLAAVSTVFRAGRDLADPQVEHTPADPETAGYTKLEMTSAIDGLALTLALAEIAWLGRATAAASEELLNQLDLAIIRLETSRLGVRVIAGSKGPFAIALRRILGDIATMLATCGGVRAGLLGFHVALLAKRTGMAAIIREQHHQLRSAIGEAVRQIMNVETGLRAQAVLQDSVRAAEGAKLRDFKNLLAAISPVFASWLFAQRIDPAAVVDKVGDRWALDFVALGAADSPVWFRTLITPTGALSFDRVPVGGRFAEFFVGDRGRVRRLRDEFLARLPIRDDAWDELARELLPPALLDVLVGRAQHDPIELLISSHGLLNSFPWQALRIARDGRRLVESAVVMRSPVLFSLTAGPIPPVRDPALVQLVSDGFENRELAALDFTEERTAWRLEHSGQATTVNLCRLRSAVWPMRPSHFERAVSDYGFVHVATHGEGDKLGQHIYVPESFHTYEALQTRWPEAVLLAACSLGDDADRIDEEALGFAVATLAGGARCVVAGHGAVDNRETDLLAAAIVQGLRDNPGIDLARALRLAQLARITELGDPDCDIYAWGSFSAFVR